MAFLFQCHSKTPPASFGSSISAVQKPLASSGCRPCCVSTAYAAAYLFKQPYNGLFFGPCDPPFGLGLVYIPHSTFHTFHAAVFVIAERAQRSFRPSYRVLQETLTS